MVSIPKAVGVLSCGFLLCLGLSNAVQADNAASFADKLKADQSDRRQGSQKAGETQMNDMKSDHSIDGRMIKGEVMRVEGDDYIVNDQDGKEVRLHIDLVTVMARNIEPGQSIEAKVDDQNHVIAILSASAVTDRRNDKE